MSQEKNAIDKGLLSILMNADNSNGIFTPELPEEDKEKLFKNKEDTLKIKADGEEKASELYKAILQKKKDKHPEDYKVKTPKGEMTIKEAKEKGYDFVTKRFNKKKPGNFEKENEKDLAKLNDSDREAIKKLLDPKQVGLSKADAESMSINPDSDLVKKDLENKEAEEAKRNNIKESEIQGQEDGEAKVNIMSLLGGGM